MRLLLASVLLYAAAALAQINVAFQNENSTTQAGMACITAYAGYSAAYCDCVEVALDPSPDLGEVDPDLAPTIRIGCPSGMTYDLYEMNVVIERGRGLVARHPDSCRVTASICVDVSRCINPDAFVEYGITWFGYAKNPPSDGYPYICADAGYSGRLIYRQ